MTTARKAKKIAKTLAPKKGHRTLGTEMMRVPSEFAESVRSAAEVLGVNGADIMRALVNMIPDALEQLVGK
jgi:hypothetical protein